MRTRIRLRTVILCWLCGVASLLVGLSIPQGWWSWVFGLGWVFLISYPSVAKICEDLGSQ